jgi:transcriptional regulator with XRE-family HTH domain
MGAIGTASFGLLLRRYRRMAGLTQEELAKRAQVSAPTISALDAVSTNCAIPDTFDRLAKALQLSPEERSALRDAPSSPYPVRCASGRGGGCTAPRALHQLATGADQLHRAGAGAGNRAAAAAGGTPGDADHGREQCPFGALSIANFDEAPESCLQAGR